MSRDITTDPRDFGQGDSREHGSRMSLSQGRGSWSDDPGRTRAPPAEIRALREQSHMSQAVFARCLNLTVGYVSQLERGAKRPTGPALASLDVIRRKGIEAII